MTTAGNASPVSPLTRTQPQGDSNAGPAPTPARPVPMHTPTHTPSGLSNEKLESMLLRLQAQTAWGPSAAEPPQQPQPQPTPTTA